MKIISIPIKRNIVSETNTSITFLLSFNPNKNECQCYGDCDCSEEYFRLGKNKERITQYNTYQKFGKVKAKISTNIEQVKEIETEIEKLYNQFHIGKKQNDLSYLFEKTVRVNKNGRIVY